jgi:predicted nucleic acid-binding protein
LVFHQIFVDTSYVIGLINERDNYHDLALKLADVYEGYPLVISEAILLEIGNALSRRYKSEGSVIIDYFLEDDNVTVIPLHNDLFIRGFELYKTYQDKDWGLVDCISFIIMRENNISNVLTFDHKVALRDRHFSQAGLNILAV